MNNENWGFKMSQLVAMATAIAQTAETARELNRQFSTMLDSAGIDTDDPDFVSCYGYLEGDCDAEPILNYIKEKMKCSG